MFFPNVLLGREYMLYWVGRVCGFKLKFIVVHSANLHNNLAIIARILLNSQRPRRESFKLITNCNHCNPMTSCTIFFYLFTYFFVCFVFVFVSFFFFFFVHLLVDYLWSKTKHKKQTHISVGGLKKYSWHGKYIVKSKMWRLEMLLPCRCVRDRSARCNIH